MALPRLSNEVWDNVIDQCQGPLDPRLCDPEDRFDPLYDAYRALLSCSLVCSAWLPRCRINLYSTILLRRRSDVYNLLETLSTHPFLADRVHTLAIYSEKEYVPSADTRLVGRLLQVRTLVLYLNWSHYPQGYQALAARYPISQLLIWRDLHTSDELGRLVLAFCNIESLTLGTDDDHFENISRVPHLRVDPAQAHPTCSRFTRTIRRLQISGNLLPSAHFPSWVPLITSVVHLVLQWTYFWFEDTRSDARAVLAYIASLKHLESLTIEVISKAYNITFGEDGEALATWLISVISQTSTHTALRIVHLAFWLPGVPWWDYKTIKPRRFLTTHLTPTFENAICEIPALKELAFEIGVMPRGGDTPEWWKDNIRACLPRLRAEISVKLFLRSEHAVAWGAGRPNDGV
ncbi:hypothetical protein C8Q79DRAFT_6587 [Trametes meyenii]|nr:hypothetical protein C8Q79DRAFT_6587 [Trametes meyenii]